MTDTNPPFRLPKDDEHILICGKNGTGKTHAGIWQLSLRSYDVRPWIIVDIKRDRFIRDIEAQEIDVRGSIPRTPGLYVVRPMIGEEAAVDEFLVRVWEREGIGVMVDEGFALGPRNHGFRLLLMQGRSKNCPCIVLSQRPLYLDRYVLSECSHYQVFKLNDRRDWEVIQNFASGIKGSDRHYGISRRNSMWYNSNDEGLYRLAPAPPRDVILQTFEDRRPRRREKWV